MQRTELKRRHVSSWASDEPCELTCLRWPCYGEAMHPWPSQAFLMSVFSDAMQDVSLHVIASQPATTVLAADDATSVRTAS